MDAMRQYNCDEIIERGSIKDTDVSRLKAAFYSDAMVEQAEAEMLFALNQGCPVQDPSWAFFFNDAIVDYIVRQATPEGYVTVENAAWLTSHACKGGKVRTKNELELLISVIEKARWSPPRLVKLCIEQVRNAVLDADSPLREGNNQNIGKIQESEVELIRRMIYAFGGDGDIAVTRAEAEVLFEINDALSTEDVNPAWTELFVKAIANSVMASSGYKVPSREEALHAEQWLDARDDLSPANMISAIVNASLDNVFNSYQEQSREERAIARLERQRLEIVTNEVITDDEAQWIAARLGRDGAITPTEQAMVGYLGEFTGNLHEVLRDTIDRVSAAA